MTGVYMQNFIHLSLLSRSVFLITKKIVSLKFCKENQSPHLVGNKIFSPSKIEPFMRWRGKLCKGQLGHR